MTGIEHVTSATDEELTERLREIELEQRRLEAELATVIAEVDRRGSWQVDTHRSLKGWLKANTNWSNGQVTARRRLARVVTDLPEVGRGLAEGRIGVAQAGLLADARANPRCGDELGESIELLLDNCEQLSFEHAKRCVTHWRNMADEDGAFRDRERSERARTATVTTLDESLHIVASGGGAAVAAEVTAIYDAFLEQEFAKDVEERTRLHGADAPTALLPRNDAQRHFDTLVSVFRAANHAGAAAGGPPTPTVVNVIVDQLTFELALHRAGLVNDPVDLPEPPAGDRRCETDTGTALLPVDAVRGALTGHVRRVVLDSKKVVIEMGRKRRLFTGMAREAVKLMSATCEMPGCDVKVTSTQVDHIAEWARQQGTTDPGNAANACTGHNRDKHRARVRVERLTGGLLAVYRADGTRIGPVGQRSPVDHQPPDAVAESRTIRAMVDALAGPDKWIDSG